MIPAGALQTDGGLHTLSVSGGGGAIVQYAPTQDGQFYVPGEHRQAFTVLRPLPPTSPHLELDSTTYK